MKKHTLVTITLLATLILSPQVIAQPISTEDTIVQVGQEHYTLDQYSTFSSMVYKHPVLHKEAFYPGKRKMTTQFSETMFLYPEAQSYEHQFTTTKEWQWKETYLLGQWYQDKIIIENLGATEKELKKFYKRNRKLFPAADTLSKEEAFQQNREAIITKRFLAHYPPTKEFKEEMGDVADSLIEMQWLRKPKSMGALFFLPYSYEKAFGTPMPTDISELIGENKLITEEDLVIITGWLPKGKRGIMENPQQRIPILKFILSWKLFANAAQEAKIDKTPAFQSYKTAFKKYEAVKHYINIVLMGELDDSITIIDNDELMLAYQDTRGALQEEIDSSLLINLAHAIQTERTAIALNKIIAEKRSKSGITIIHHDFDDPLAMKSDQLAHLVDSLVKNNQIAEAKKINKTLMAYYAHTEEGKKAYANLARQFIDEEQYKRAIQTYRNAILYKIDEDRECKKQFMIAYIYGENLQNNSLAAANFQRVLQKCPEGDLADDAEFMYLHIGEPYLSITDLQEEFERQGRSH